MLVCKVTVNLADEDPTVAVSKPVSNSHEVNSGHDTRLFLLLELPDPWKGGYQPAVICEPQNLIEGNRFFVRRPGGYALGKPLFAVALDHDFRDLVDADAAQVLPPMFQAGALAHLSALPLLSVNRACQVFVQELGERWPASRQLQLARVISLFPKHHATIDSQHLAGDEAIRHEVDVSRRDLLHRAQPLQRHALTEGGLRRFELVGWHVFPELGFLHNAPERFNPIRTHL
jgi:hypothetical protein